MFGLFKPNPEKKLAKAIELKRKEAVEAQRSGDMRAFAALSSEVTALEDELIALRAED